MCIGRRLRGYVPSRLGDDADAETVNCAIGYGCNQGGEDGTWVGQYLHEVSGILLNTCFLIN